MSDGMERREHVRTPESDEVLRRVGRNVVIFQQVESVLKYLNAHSDVHAPLSRWPATLKNQIASVHKKTLGELAGKRAKGPLQAATEDESPTGIDEAWFRFRFSAGVDAEFLDRHHVEMRALVDARNELVHHFLPRWQLAVEGATDGALMYLDTQRADAVRMLERLQDWANALQAGRKRLAEILLSPAGVQWIDVASLQSSRLVAMLGEVALKAARLDGWASLSTAGQLIKREAPAELQDFRQRFGLPNLKAVLLGSEMFDVKGEVLPSGGTQTVYRINERYELHIPQESGGDGPQA